MTEPVGSLGEEASRLFAAAEEWLHGARDPGAAAGTAAAAHAGPDCAICPVCQLLALVRGARPEVVEHLTAAVVALVSAARAAFDAPDRGAAPRRGSSVERIDVG